MMARNMACWTISALLAGALLLNCAASAAPRDETEDEKSAQSEEGWIVLFNGKDLTGWRNARSPEEENRWFVEEGALTNTEHANDIATVQQWKDFELELEYRIVPGGNSGVYLRGRIEVQVLDSYGKPEIGPGDDGAIYGQFPPKVNASKPAGEWNKLEARYVGDSLSVRLNGKVVHDNQLITELTGGALPGGVNDPGPLMLQGDHGKVWYRNIRIRPLVEQSPDPQEELS